MERSRSPLEQVITALRERNISFKREDIESVFSDAVVGSANSTWVSDYLSPDTLLSGEEITLYARLESSGTLHTLLQNADLSITRPFLDNDIRNAIDSLKASTAAIEKQTKILTIQCDDLKEQLHNDKERQIGRKRALAELHRRHGLENQHITAAADDLMHDLQTRMRTERESTTTESRKLLSLITARLKEDDRALQSLEKLASGIGSNEEDRAAGRRATELTTKLAGYVSEEIQHRLDRLFMETMQPGTYEANGETDDKNELLTALQEELESLYPEITVLSEISTRQQFSEPIQRELEYRHGKLHSTSEKKLDYIWNMITEMTLSIQGITERLADRQSHRATLEGLTAAYKSELDEKPSDHSSRRGTLWKDSIKTSLRSRGSGERKSVFFLPESQTLEAFLRRLGASVDSIFRPSEEDGGPNYFHEKKLRMLERLRNLAVVADLPLLAHLNLADQARQLLHFALHADSSFSVSLADVFQERNLANLEAQLALVQKAIEGINLDPLHQRDKTQERFMERWS